ncbi:MAG: hypothetical protein J7L61_03195 [Thermoplasmata archaeon]|nr:hypothetical protein [Thermoplasmata archaeon]
MAMDAALLLGVLGAAVLVAGAGWPEPAERVHPTGSVKNWLLSAGAVVMLAYAVLKYLGGGPVFFVFLQTLVVAASILMMADVPERVNVLVIPACGILLVLWSLLLFEDYTTVLFILGLSAVGLGYVFEMATLRRSLSLTAGGVLIAVFSYLGGNWIFFWMNASFAALSGSYTLKMLLDRRGEG